MGLIKTFWKRISYTKAIDNASGSFEIAFFESIYRVQYAAGLSTVDHSIWYLIYSSIVRVMVAYVLFGEVWYAYSDTRSMDEAVGCINVIVIRLITLCKIKNMVDNKKLYKKLTTFMDVMYVDVSTKQRKKLVKYWASTHESYLKLLLTLGSCTVAAWLIHPLVDDIEYNIMSEIHIPFRYDNDFLYPIVYSILSIAFTYSSFFVMVVDLILQAHLVPLICQMTILADYFENIIQDCGVGLKDMMMDELVSDSEFRSRYLKRLGKLVKQHNVILNYSMALRSALSWPMLAQLAASGTLICFVGFQATAAVVDNITKCLTSIFYLGYNMFGLYILCRWCEEITAQSLSIGNAAYCSGWECGTSTYPGVRATILLVIGRANKPLVFSAGGLYNLSLSSYTALVKTSYSALTVLLRFRHE